MRFNTKIAENAERADRMFFERLQEGLKSGDVDKIYEFISRIEWEFYEALSHYFPFALHKRGIMPPRIETYYTDIDYHEDCRAFWDSIGVAEYQGQFIDERQKVFFECKLSGRYEQTQANNRLIYIIKDDGIEAGQFKSVKDDVYFHLKDYAIEYFKILFLDILSRESGKIVVSYKHKLDKIKLRKNRLKSLLKLKYEFSLDIDDYNRYVRDDTWTQVVKKLEEIYADSDEMAKKLTKPFYISYKNFCNAAISGTKKIKTDINVLLSEFEDKERVNPKFCVNAKLWCKIEQKYFKAGAAQAAAAFSTKITALRGDVKGRGVSLRSSRLLTFRLQPVSPACGRQRTPLTVRELRSSPAAFRSTSS